jgi:hypothetical protein
MWITPKTDWTSSDYFNIEDYSRIVGNIQYLRDFISTLFSDITLESVESEKQYDSMIYAEEINAIERNLEKINVYDFDIGETKVYYVNEHTPNFEEFNRIESATLKLYTTIKAQYDVRRRLAFRLGSGKQLNVVRE